MYVLGIHGSFARTDHDSAAALMRDNEVVAAAEEERFSRHKHAVGVMPDNAIRYCLREAGISMAEVDHIAFPRSTWLDFGPRLDAYLEHRFGACPPATFLDHHTCHAAMAFYTSGLPDGLVVSIDQSGDGVSCAIYRGDADGLRLIDATPFPDSLGLFAALMTQYLGFRSNHDEYKLMGLAPYGEPQFDLSPIIGFVDGHIRLDAKVLHQEIFRGHPYCRTDQLPIFRESLPGLPARRFPGEELRAEHRNLAASAQKHIEELILATVAHHRTASDRHLLMTGGVAENTVANGRLAAEGGFESVFVSPASGDAGTALGAAFLLASEQAGRPKALTTAQLGPSYSNDEVREILERCGTRFTETQDVAHDVSEMLCAGKTVAWFAGRLEFGPRALGGRSILADASSPETKGRVNKIKHRESFRPFGASILAESAGDLFTTAVDAPYMSFAMPIRPSSNGSLGAVTHVDGTSRLHTVARGDAVYRRLIEQVHAKSGIPAVLNTSLNSGWEPIVESPEQALAFFYSSAADVLALEDHLIVK